MTSIRRTPALSRSVAAPIVVVKTRAGLPDSPVKVLTQATGIIGSFFLPSTGLPVGVMSATTWPRTSGLLSPGKGSWTP